MCNFSCPLLVSVALTLGCQGTQRLKGLEVSLHIEGFPSVGGTWKKKKKKRGGGNIKKWKKRAVNQKKYKLMKKNQAKELKCKGRAMRRGGGEDRSVRGWAVWEDLWAWVSSNRWLNWWWKWDIYVSRIVKRWAWDECKQVTCFVKYNCLEKETRRRVILLYKYF